MGSFRDRLIRFMYGRYGTDQLNIALFVIYFLLLLINLFTRNLILPILMWAVLIWTLFRSLSRNIYEDKGKTCFLKLWRPVSLVLRLISAGCVKYEPSFPPMHPMQDSTALPRTGSW